MRQLRSDLRGRGERSVQPFADRLIAGFDVPPVHRAEFALGTLQAHIQLLEQPRTLLTNGLVEEITLSELTPAITEVSTANPVMSAVQAEARHAEPDIDEGPAAIVDGGRTLTHLF